MDEILILYKKNYKVFIEINSRTIVMCCFFLIVVGKIKLIEIAFGVSKNILGGGIMIKKIKFFLRESV